MMLRKNKNCYEFQFGGFSFSLESFAIKLKSTTLWLLVQVLLLSVYLYYLRP